MKRFLTRYFVIALVLIAALMGGISFAQKKTAGRVDLQEGDIIFQTYDSEQGRAINLATHSRYSHCGIIFRIGGKLYVYEAVGPVRSTPLQEWIAHGKNGHYAVKRLKNANTLLTPEAIEKIRAEGLKLKGKPYDFVFGWSDDRIYCSELIYKVYHRALGLEVGKIRRLGDFDLEHPLVKKKLRERYGDNIPMDEPVVSPQAIFESDLLVSVE